MRATARKLSSPATLAIAERLSLSITNEDFTYAWACRSLGMALVTSSSRCADDATRRSERAHAAKVVPLEQRPEPLAARVDEGTRRESIRMELLVERALAARSRSFPQPPMCDISTRGRSTGVPCVRSSE